jgi:AraC family transcriptional regulator
MKESWISERRTLQLPGLAIDRHTSKPNELDFPGCDDHLLCLLLSEGNRQKITRIGEQKSEKSQLQGEFWICSAQTSGLWAWDSIDQSLMFVLQPHALNRIAAEVSEGAVDQVELLNTISACDPQINAIDRLFQAELDGCGIGGSLYTESLAQVLIIHLLRHYCVLQAKVQLNSDGLSAQPGSAPGCPLSGRWRMASALELPGLARERIPQFVPVSVQVVGNCPQILAQWSSGTRASRYRV